MTIAKHSKQYLPWQSNASPNKLTPSNYSRQKSQKK
jgi:hypothetical protein